MKYALGKTGSKKNDEYSINKIGIPSLVLMERAAESVALKVAEIAVIFHRDVKIIAVCTQKNNGADAVASARILTLQGMRVDIAIAGDPENGTEEFRKQLEIARNAGLTIFGENVKIEDYDIVIDGLFGIGLSRNVEGMYARLIDRINSCNNYVVSVDIPSGIDADTGRVMGTAIKADSTVTFGYMKAGMLLPQGKMHCGEISVCDIGFAPFDIEGTLSDVSMYFTQDDIANIPKRRLDAHKGTYKKCLIIAGSEDMSGAAYLSGLAAFKCGTGLVKIVSAQSNCEVLRRLLPEAIVIGYEKENATEIIGEELKKADIAVLGPGLSTTDTAVSITEYVIKNINRPIIIDADAINIISSRKELLSECRGEIIITPHVGEMARFTGLSPEEINFNLREVAINVARKYNIICVLKSSVSVVTDGDKTVINTSGCPAMAKAGMGDVLTGIIAGMLALSLTPLSAAAMGTYIHGLCGEKAAQIKGEHSVLASDAAEAICIK